ncbi:MAG TPA: STAS domain-containing protein [Solirubrobacterales bacterium]|nr:STAS domain-containing protein [Solirubrobacterales bacterium]
MNPNRFEVAEEEQDGVRILAVTGELDLHTVPQLEEQLESVENGLLLDLSNCEFIDSTGIGLIVRTWQRLNTDLDRDDTCRFALCGLGDQVQRLLEITGLESSLRTYAARDEALAELRSE